MKALFRVSMAVLTASATALLLLIPKAFASAPYRLVHESTLTEQCVGCEQPATTYTVRGALEITSGGSPLGKNFWFDQIDFYTVDRPGAAYRLTGTGSYSFSFGSPVSWTQVQLSLQITDGTTNWTRFFYRRTPGGGLPPWEDFYHFSASQLDPNQSPVFSIAFTCAPVPEIWFSTQRALTSADAAIGHLEMGDILSDAGTVVRRITDLLAPFGITFNAAIQCDIDALSVVSGGELVFSLRQDIENVSAGRLRHGDLLSAKGTVFRTNAELLSKFGVAPTSPDVGLDGVEVAPSGLILFSIKTNVFSEKLGQMLTSGDLLTDDGQIFSTERKLLAYLLPAADDGHYGLTGFHVFAPNTETWFSTEKDFQSVLGPVRAGDILSTRGYIVARNHELVASFKPIEDAVDFGLDALFLIAPSQANPPAVRLESISLTGVGLSWSPIGRVWQLHGALSANGPYSPISPRMLETKWLDPVNFTTKPTRFYRIQTW